MASEVRCTPLYGARTALVEIGSVHILLNCGWDVAFDVASLEPLREVASKINLVLLTHHSLEHLGGQYMHLGLALRLAHCLVRALKHSGCACSAGLVVLPARAIR